MTITERKWARIKKGERVVASDKEMDYFETQDEWRRLCSKSNPDRSGTLDTYLVWLRPDKDTK